MPGIVGLITKRQQAEAEGELRAMLESIRHEPFYTTGTWIDAAAGIYVGWVARQNSFSAHMPLENERRDVTLVFSGEEFPDAGTVKVPGESYLLDRYDREADFPGQLNGRFHGLLRDRSRGMTMLFNDRFGLQRLYYHQGKEAFYFAAEAKAILKVQPELRRADPRGLGEFIACGCVLENRSLFSGIHVLPPGSAWRFRNATLEKKAAYFEPREWEAQEALEPTAYYAELRDVFGRNLPRYFNGRERSLPTRS